MRESAPRQVRQNLSIGPGVARAISICLFLVLVLHAAGVGMDGVAAIRFPLELDYGEGIVWQQARLIPGPTMYSRGQDLPFIVFHYPPVYYLVTRLVASFLPDMRAAGRFVSELSTLLTAGVAGALVYVSGRRAVGGLDRTVLFYAVVTSLLLLSMHAVRYWGVLMRVDMLAIVLGETGLLIGILARGRQPGTTIALLFCTAAVFTKQIVLAPGIAIFVVAMMRNPRAALGAAAVAGGLGLIALAYLQIDTAGGFLLNIVTYNINRTSLSHGLDVIFWQERDSLIFVVPLMVAFVVIVRPLAVSLRDGLREGGLARARQALCLENPTAYAVTVLAVYFCLSSTMLLSIFKSGSTVNYMLEWFFSGVVLLGILLCRLAAGGSATRPHLALASFMLFLGVVLQPLRALPDTVPEEFVSAQRTLVRRIAEAEKPVASENMSLIVQAGKSVVFEPAIVTELARLGKWDEAPLVRMIRSGGFAFFLTTDNEPGGTDRRSPAVDAAMRAAYPIVEPTAIGMWLHRPLP